MRLVFADTLYRGAVLHQYRAQVIRAQKALADIRLVTTDEVLTELLDGLAQHGAHLREVAARAVRKILDDRRVTVHPQPVKAFCSNEAAIWTEPRCQPNHFAGTGRSHSIQTGCW